MDTHAYIIRSIGVLDEPEKRPVRVNFFAKHSIQVGDVQHTIISVRAQQKILGKSNHGCYFTPYRN